MNETTIYIVDDDAGIRQSLEYMLQFHDYNTEAYASADVFLAALDRARPGCLLLDVRMLGMDGLALQEHLVAHSPHLPVILISGHGDIEMAVKAMKAGAVDFIEKPFSNDAILGAIDRALTHEDEPLGPPRQKSIAQARFGRLTARERQVLEILVMGRSNKSIAKELSISPRTVEIHRARIMEKTDVDNFAGLTRLAVIAGL